ncbi:hypothetical protein ACUN0C_05350 [Faunimonas sp. B44]|uniref:hypothetical protein n=1 Tax=Faunimonas sp. B44 TaxID=3461493 RepID=UPI00404417A0
MVPTSAEAGFSFLDRGPSAALTDGDQARISARMSIEERGCLLNVAARVRERAATLAPFDPRAMAPAALRLDQQAELSLRTASKTPCRIGNANAQLSQIKARQIPSCVRLVPCTREENMRNALVRLALIGTMSAIGTMAGLAAASAETVAVSLWDKGAETEMATGLAMGTDGADPSKATFGIDAEPKSVRAGEVTFEIRNVSKDMIHELVVTPLRDGERSLPYDESEQEVAEDDLVVLGEVEDLDPGQSGTLTLRLEPGEYVLFCNIAGHYDGGMWTLLTVEP